MSELPGAAPPLGVLAFQVLGPLAVTLDGVPRPLGGRQQRAVLAALLLSPDAPRSVDQLADALWGDAVPGGAVSTIQTYVSHLREVLEPGRARGAPAVVLRTEGRGYRLHPEPDALDAAVFARRVRVGRDLLAAGDAAGASTELGAALAGWRGDVLADLAGYPFVQAEAQRLDQLRAGALETRVDADLTLGRHRDVVDELDRLVAAYPLHEGLHAHRMLARYRCGRQADALTAYRELRQTLADELGIDPSPALQRLHERVLAQDPALEVPPPPATAPATSASSAPPSTTTTPLADPAPADADPAPADPAPAPAPADATPADAGAGSATPRRRRRRSWVLGGAGAAVLVAGTITAVVWSGESTLTALPANSVGAIDADGGLRSSLPVGTSPDGVAYGAGFIWVTNTGNDSVSMIDPEDNRVVQTIDVGDAPTAVTVTGDDVWVANNGDATVSRVSARTRREVGTPVEVGNGPSAIASGPTGVWVANTTDNTVQRIDPISGATGDPVAVGNQPAGIAVDDTTVWVTDLRDGAVVPIEAGSGQPGSSITVGGGPRGLAVTDDAVWVANSLDGTVSRIDRTRRRVTQTVAVGDGPRALAAGPDAVWVSNEFDATMTRIDPAHVDDVRRIAVGSSPHGLALAGPTVWVATGGFAGEEHRGGTLVVQNDAILLADGLPDPAQSYEFDVTSLMYDGLVKQRRTAGPGSGAPVPDLATDLPHPTDGGLTYTFTVRRGVRYSDGTEVHADDLARGVQRALQFPAAGARYYAGIVGAAACIEDYAHCDLSRGVVVDRAASTITFHLLAPDTEFLEKLSIFAVATAPGVPTTPVSTPMPATGPYMFSGFDQKDASTHLTVVRNPAFHVWNAAAQPAGFPDRIEWRVVADLRTRIDDVLAGRADVTDLSGDVGVQSELAARYPDQVHADAVSGTWYEFLNTTVTPFDDVRVRQALNYAVDRTVLAQILRTGEDRVSCQLLPPDFPGYEPYCPYTTGVGDGRYHGPDVARAKELVEAAGTAGTPITIWTVDGLTQFVQAAQYYVEVLAELGYPATVHAVPFRQELDDISTPSLGVQMGANLWSADFTTASNFWEPVLSCAAISAVDSGNFSSYCQQDVDAMAAHALEIGRTDPAAANRLWSEIDRRITSDAPWVFGPNTLAVNLVSSRVGNFQFDPVSMTLYSQLWVQ